MTRGEVWTVSGAGYAPEQRGLRHLPGRWRVRDEHYQTKDFSRDDIRVLARLDPSTVDLTHPQVHRTDGDFPVAWAGAIRSSTAP